MRSNLQHITIIVIFCTHTKECLLNISDSFSEFCMMKIKVMCENQRYTVCSCLYFVVFFSFYRISANRKCAEYFIVPVAQTQFNLSAGILTSADYAYTRFVDCYVQCIQGTSYMYDELPLILSSYQHCIISFDVFSHRKFQRRCWIGLDRLPNKNLMQKIGMNTLNYLKMF